MANKQSLFVLGGFLITFSFAAVFIIIGFLTNNHSEDFQACDATSTMIFWNTNSSNAENELKAILTANYIDYTDLNSQEWDSETSTIDGIRDIALSFIDTTNGSWATLALPLNSNLAYTISVCLSKISSSPVITFLEFEKSAWGYCLFEKGKLIDKFWNNHWAVNKAPKDCSPDIDLVASKFGVEANLIQPYLQDVLDKYDLGKAYESDEFNLTDHWVKCDFMNKIGLSYPNMDKVKWFHIIE